MDPAHDISDGALLALIVNDQEALEVLAAWGALRCKAADAMSNQTIHEIMTLLSCRRENVHRCLLKLVAARVLRDGGISELADKVLQNHVHSQIGRKRKDESR